MRRNRTIAAVLALLALPLVVAIVESIAFTRHNHNNGALVSAGRRREYLLYVPKRYDRARPTPLIISMHGAGGWPAQQRDMTLWNRLADEQGFIVVYPSAIGGKGLRVWYPDDAQFISDLIDELRKSYNIDPARIYANGLSNGGEMSFVLSCKLSHRIAAVGLVAAAQAVPWNWCTDKRAVPMIWFHGTEDPDVPYGGGATWVSLSHAFPSVQGWTAKWARRNGCAPQPVESIVAADVTRREYTRCTNDASVVLYTIRGGGHTWPGGEPLPEFFCGRTSRSIDATRVMWAFFRAHPLAEDCGCED